MTSRICTQQVTEKEGKKTTKNHSEAVLRSRVLHHMICKDHLGSSSPSLKTLVATSSSLGHFIFILFIFQNKYFDIFFSHVFLFLFCFLPVTSFPVRLPLSPTCREKLCQWRSSSACQTPSTWSPPWAPWGSTPSRCWTSAARGFKVKTSAASALHGKITVPM